MQTVANLVEILGIVVVVGSVGNVGKLGAVPTTTTLPGFSPARARIRGRALCARPPLHFSFSIWGIPNMGQFSRTTYRYSVRPLRYRSVPVRSACRQFPRASR